MSNYTNENLINVPSSNVPAGTLAMKIGDNIFTAGAVVISSGTDVSSTTAVADKVLSGYLFYDSDGIVTSGTISIISGGTITPTTSNQIISSGVYLGGSQTILGDPALVASNIVSGVSIFGVSGTAQPGGTSAPGEGGSSPFDLVKVTNYTPTPSFNLTVQKVTGFSDSGLVRTYTTTGTDLSLTAADVLPVVNRLGIANDTKLLLLTNQTSSQILLPSGFIWGYDKGQVLEQAITATNHDVIADVYGNFTLGDGKYFDFDSSVLSGHSPRTFMFQATLLGNQMQFVDGGDQAGSAMFGLGWGYNSGKLFYHFWSADNGSWLDLATGSYVIAFVYDGQTLTVYKDGEVLGSQTITLNTGSGYMYRIGQYTCDDWDSTGEWKSNFCAVFNRALTAAEVAAISAAVAPAV